MPGMGEGSAQLIESSERLHGRDHCHYFHFTDEETGTERLNKLQKVTQ